MLLLKDEPFVATWKSFKKFKSTGAIQYDTGSSYVEFKVDEDRMLSINEHKNNSTVEIAKTDKWELILKDGKHFLQIPGVKQHLEVITINHTVMVLREANDKIFFAKDAHWKNSLKTNSDLIM